MKEVDFQHGESQQFKEELQIISPVTTGNTHHIK